MAVLFSNGRNKGAPANPINLRQLVW